VGDAETQYFSHFIILPVGAKPGICVTSGPAFCQARPRRRWADSVPHLSIFTDPQHATAAFPGMSPPRCAARRACGKRRPGKLGNKGALR